VVFALGAEGRAVGGCDLAIASRLPRESGLSSSAALEVSIATALALASGRRLGARDRARIAHRAETEFVGVGCGIMDQFASALGRRNHALFIDCRSEHVRPVRLPPQRLRLLIVDSGARRALAAGGYRERREQCEAALRAARASGIALAGARSLRDLEGTEMGDLERVLPRPLFRRVRHVLSENERVRAVGRAFEAGELVKVGELLRQGMRSLREDFEVSTPELDFLCARADSHPGVFGSRLTGAGFGGWSLHVVEPAAAADAAQWIACGFESRFGRRPPVLEVEAAEGAGEVALPGRG
jgi:galactokinase